MPRDINERGRDLDQVLTQYMTFVKPAFDEFCSPVSNANSLAMIKSFKDFLLYLYCYRLKNLLMLLYQGEQII